MTTPEKRYNEAGSEVQVDDPAYAEANTGTEGVEVDETNDEEE